MRDITHKRENNSMKPRNVGARPSTIKYDNSIISTTSPCSKTRAWGMWTIIPEQTNVRPLGALKTE